MSHSSLNLSTIMEIQPCSPIAPYPPVASKTDYERAYTTAFNREAPRKKRSFSPKPLLPQQRSSDIILNGKPSSVLETTIESAVENDEFV